MNKKILLILPEQMKKALTEIAGKNDMSVNELIRKQLEFSLMNYEHDKND